MTDEIIARVEDESELIHVSVETIPQAVEEDIKALYALIQNGASSTAVEQKIAEAISAFRTEIYGGEVEASLDTLKELGEKLKSLEGDDSIKGAILTKFGELSSQITAQQQQLDAQQIPQNLVEIYQQAKNS